MLRMAARGLAPQEKADDDSEKARRDLMAERVADFLVKFHPPLKTLAEGLRL